MSQRVFRKKKNINQPDENILPHENNERLEPETEIVNITLHYFNKWFYLANRLLPIGKWFLFEILDNLYLLSIIFSGLICNSIYLRQDLDL